MWRLGLCDDLVERPESKSQTSTHFYLPIESILGAHHLAKSSPADATPGSQMEDRQGIVGAEQEPVVEFGVSTEVEQHLEAVRQRQSGNVGVEMRVTLCKILKRREEFLVQHQAVAAGMGRDDCGAFVQCQFQSIGVTDRLVFADQAKLIPDMAEKRQLPFGERSVERFVVRISRVELLRVREDLHQCGSGIGTAMDFFDGILSLRIDRDAGEKFIWIALRGFQHVVVADQKIRVCLIQPAVLVVDPIHAEEDSLLNMA